MSIDILKNTRKGLVLNGGGVLGVAHVGALKRLNELGKFEYEYYAGSSVGAIIATGMALDASYEFIERLVARVDFNVLLDDTPYDANVLDILRLLRKYGWYKGEALKELYRSFIHDLTGNGDITMLEAYNLTGKFLLLTAFKRMIQQQLKSQKTLIHMCQLKMPCTGLVRIHSYLQLNQFGL